MVVKLGKVQGYALGLLRLGMGWILLWAFLDKLFGLGFTTTPDKAWLVGNSPTSGFLLNATRGPLAEFFKGLAGNVLVDWLFMIGLLLIGLALIFGILVRIAAYSGALLFLLMWLAVLPPEHNPFLDEHIIYSLVLIALAYVKSGKNLGFGKKWAKTELVKKYTILE